MIRIAAAALLAFAALPAAADEIAVFDAAGAAQVIDTANVEKCQMFFDSKGNPFEICRLERVEMRPPSATRMRPGQTEARDRPSVIYAKTE